MTTTAVSTATDEAVQKLYNVLHHRKATLSIEVANDLASGDWVVTAVLPSGAKVLGRAWTFNVAVESLLRNLPSAVRDIKVGDQWKYENDIDAMYRTVVAIAPMGPAPGEPYAFYTGERGQLFISADTARLFSSSLKTLSRPNITLRRPRVAGYNEVPFLN
jgi:hypothetical protein